MITTKPVLEIPWQPSASMATLKKRAEILKLIRGFFYAKNILEVETPLLCHTSVTDPFIESIPALISLASNKNELRYFLQTSPEYAMKRLLAAGSGSIFQISKAFRQGEIGHFHNPEFSMLEWYHLDFTQYELMDEVDELLQLVLKVAPAERISYQALFETYLEINPHCVSVAKLATCARNNGINIVEGFTDQDSWLNLLMSHVIEPQLGKEKPCFVYDFPCSQAALAKIKPGDPPTASRFEVYFHGVELANGFHELQDAHEQRARFEKNMAERKRLNLSELVIDDFFLASLSYGLPDCSGVAVGIDRLIMLATNATKISDVLSFDFSRV